MRGTVQRPVSILKITLGSNSPCIVSFRSLGGRVFWETKRLIGWPDIVIVLGEVPENAKQHRKEGLRAHSWLCIA